jgi:hypothetical protein
MVTKHDAIDRPRNSREPGRPRATRKSAKVVAIGTVMKSRSRIVVCCFGVDDSEIEIEGRPHTILAAVGFHCPQKVETALNGLKLQFGLTPADEVKWNGMKPMPTLGREALSQELMVQLQESVPLVSISEGRDKQHTAQHLAAQIKDFISRHPYALERKEEVDLAFDDGILRDGLAYSRFLQSLSPSPIASANSISVGSHESAVIQLADVLAGFNRLATEISLGRENKQILVRDEALQGDIPVDLLSYISIALRWEMWGRFHRLPTPRTSHLTVLGPSSTSVGLGFAFIRRYLLTLSRRSMARVWFIWAACIRLRVVRGLDAQGCESQRYDVVHAAMACDVATYIV